MTTSRSDPALSSTPHSEPDQPWPRCTAAARFFDSGFAAYLAENPSIRSLAARFLAEAGVRLETLIDHWVLPASPDRRPELSAIGMRSSRTSDGDEVWAHPGARLPRVRLSTSAPAPQPAVAVEDVDHFVNANRFRIVSRSGEIDSRWEEAHCTVDGEPFLAMARRGYDGFRPAPAGAINVGALKKVRAAFRSRPRSGDERRVLDEAAGLFSEASAELGAERAVDEFFAAERDCYLARNRAAAWQALQQQRLGLGWANHDHHTYRSSRAGFRSLVGLWESFGFVSRERFYAGAEAGWGAQIMEHPVSRVVLFNDVDMAPEELEVDFAATDLHPRSSLGTIGLWCALHGSSIAGAGMHHLEAEFDFNRVRINLEQAGFDMMPPFTDLPMLKQAFTRAETWQVSPERARDLRDRSLISGEQAAQILAVGAPGSHLEVLQRWDGFKGFNRTGISAIIRQTDARHAAGHAPADATSVAPDGETASG